MITGYGLKLNIQPWRKRRPIPVAEYAANVRRAKSNAVVNINGRLVHRDDAGVSPFDSVVQGGDAVWEG